MKRITCSICSMVLAAAVAPVLAQTQPATQGQTRTLEATITDVQGIVQARPNDKAQWAIATKGMKLPQSGEIRTGTKSAVQFVIEPDQKITVDRVTTIRLVEATDTDGKLRTDVGMKYGRTRFDIEAAGREHEATISTPSSTLAVRGTHFEALDQRPFAAIGISYDGTVNMKDAKKQVNFGSHNGGKAVIDVNTPSAAAHALNETTADPAVSAARSDAEAPLIDRLLSGGATVFFDREAQIKVVKGGTVPTDQQLIPALPGVINFVARWHTDADLNFSVSTPGGANNGGETLYPIGALATNSSGGKVAFDHRGGPNGGIEVIYFPTADVPSGFYALGLTLISGNPTTAQVDAFKDGQRINIFAGSQGNVTSATVQVDKPVPGFVDGTAVGVVPIGINVPFSKKGQTSSSVVSTSQTKVTTQTNTTSTTAKPKPAPTPTKSKITK